MLPCHGNRDLFRHPPMTEVYCIRPYCPEDKVTMADPQMPYYILVKIEQWFHKVLISVLDGGAEGFQGDAECRRGQSPADGAASTCL